MKRTFIAIKIHPGKELLAMMHEMQRALKGESIKWSSEDNFHLTLAFIGDTQESQLGKIRSALSDYCSGTGDFEFDIKGTGVFRSMKDPKVIWAGIEINDKLGLLHSKVIESLALAGIEIEERAYRPHLTLGRIRSIKDKSILADLTEKYAGTVFQRVNSTEIILYESLLLPSGAVYKPLQKISL